MSREKDIPEELDPSECWSTSSPIAQVWAKARLMTKGREEAGDAQQTQWSYFFRVLGTVKATEDGHIAAFQTSFPSYEEKFFETARSRQGRAEQAPAHANEHLGQMIAYARVNGVAPPWSK